MILKVNNLTSGVGLLVSYSAFSLPESLCTRITEMGPSADTASSSSLGMVLQINPSIIQPFSLGILIGAVSLIPVVFFCIFRLKKAGTDNNKTKQAVLDLREIKKRYQVFISQSLVGIWCYKVEPPMPTDLPAIEQIEWMKKHAHMEECNMETARIHDYASVEEVLGKSLGELFEKIEGSFDQLGQIWIDGNHTLDRIENPVPRIDGSLTHTLLTSTSVFEDNKIARLWGTVLDITKLKHSEEALRKALSEITHLNEQIEAENSFLREELQFENAHESIVSNSKLMKTVLLLAEKVAKTNSTALLLGETGTGKELVSKLIHETSDRNSAPFIAVNCASIASALVESELFGREKGAYTGAVTRQMGRFEAAHTGTIFLDEVGELSLDIQAKLLRILQEGEFERLGTTKTTSVDVRVIAATHRDLEDMVNRGEFREDLLYRLNVFPIRIPPLRERKEDIEPLIWRFVQEFSSQMGKRITKISKANMTALIAYEWPGNVRELRNIVERAMIVSDKDILNIQAPEKRVSRQPEALTMDDAQRQHIRAILDKTNWKIRGNDGAARLLDMNPCTLESRMKKLDIRRF